jgi:hypothetical protein
VARRALRRIVRPKPVLPYLEMHVVDHCNLNCRSCSHYSSVSPDRFVDPEAAERDFARLARLFDRVAELRLMGGEPLLHPRLNTFLTSARRRLPTSGIALVTNGMLLPSQPASFWEALAASRIRLDVTDYPIAIKRDLITERATQHGIELRFGIPIERFTKVPMDPAGTRDPEEMYRSCTAVHRCPFLRDGAVYACARIAMSGILEERFGVELPIAPADRLVLAQARTGDDVLRFLGTAAPWCRFCARDAAHEFEWSRTAGAPDEWLVSDGDATASA